MTASIDPSMRHWNYFLLLESDFKNLTRYVEPSKSNFETYSIEMVRLLLMTCSEIDVVLKEYCKLIKPNSKAKTIDKYRDELKQFCNPNFSEIEISIPRFGLKSIPWLEWGTNKTPEWWNSYNNVKHKRNSCFEEANLKNIYNALSGLFVALLFFYKSDTNLQNLTPAPEIFHAPKSFAKNGSLWDNLSEAVLNIRPSS
jgi:hypothetical protein